LRSLCDTILPKDEKSAGALEAGAPEFIDLLTSENDEFQVKLGGGLLWLDSRCADDYGKTYLECTAEQRKEILDLIAYRKNAKKDASLSQGVAFFSLLRNMTCDGLYKQDRDRRFAVHREYFPQRMAGLPGVAELNADLAGADPSQRRSG